MTHGTDVDPLPTVQAYYADFLEESRLETGPSRLEFARTKEIIGRVLPSLPAQIVDVGGAAGAYSLWLAERGYEVHLVDASARLVEQARIRSASTTAKLASLTVGDARHLPQQDSSASMVLLMGPLYHLPSATDRMLALREAYRVLCHDGILIVAAISRYASTLDGLVRKLSLDPRFVPIRDRGLAEGQHRNETDNPEYFTTAYFHRPADLEAELTAAGLLDVQVLGVEGPAGLLQDFDARWADTSLRQELLDVARALESEPSILGVSSHLLAVGRKR